jgi:uncharacterized protein (TIGR01777 family)
MVKSKVLITGASGTVGKNLVQHLLNNGYVVACLSRTVNKDAKIETFKWDIEQKQIDPNCINGVDIIVHLAGAGIADGRWTEERKQEIIESRTASIRLIYDLIKTKPNQVKRIVSASAAGYYSDRGDDLMKEEDLPAADFLGECCVLWENAVDEGIELGLSVVKFRTGIILDKNSGALEKLAAPIKLGFGATLGNGKQWMPWIHLQDVINMYFKGIHDLSLNGAYNMSAPNPVTNAELTKAVAKQLKKPLWLPNVPAFVLNLAFGEMGAVVLGSTKMSTRKIEQTGFKFLFPTIASALKNIYA